MLNSRSQKRILLITLLAVFILASFGVLGTGSQVLAAEEVKCGDSEIKLQVAIPGLQKISGSSSDKCVPAKQGFPQYVRAIYNLFIGIVGILAVVMLMMGGFQWLLAAGNAQKISGAKTTIISAAMGLVLALTSYTILALINPALLDLELNPEELAGEEYNFEAGFCRTGTEDDLVISGRERTLKCGVTYTFKSDESLSCKGASCEGESIVTTCIASTLGRNEIAKCWDLPSTIASQEFGYGYQVWQVRESEIKAITLDQAVPHDFEPLCGKLFYRESSKASIVGSHCLDGRSCVINEENGATFVKKKEDLDPNHIEEVGAFNTRNCY